MQRRLINLTFHGIGRPSRRLDADEAAVWVSHERFLQVLDAVADRNDVRITFDDGNASDVEWVLPVLRERGLTAAFFLVAGRIGRPGFVDLDGVRELSGAGMTIGCHGMRHRPWRSLDDRTLHRELAQAKNALEKIVEQPVDVASCPFGSYDRRVLRSLRKCAFRTIYTSDTGTARPRAWLQARNTIGDGDSADHLIERILSAEWPAYRAVHRRAKRVAKRWR